jgi:DNA repair exonuclease SbcCD nuclease subunit
MKLLIVHLSDIHLKTGRNTASERIRKVAAAAQSVDVDIGTAVVIASGDIAHSGNEGEYAIAATSTHELLKDIRAVLPSAQVHFVAVPGNHDCDFTDSSTQARLLILQSISRSGEIMLDENTLNLCCQLHSHFFDYLDKNETLPPVVQNCRAYYDYLVPVGAQQILIRCFNTAFASTNPEYPGQLVYPTSLLTLRNIDPAPAYTIAVFHHPYNWLTPNTKRQLSDHIDRTADLILTGHEHQTAYYKKEAFSGLISDYIEGAAFQEPDDPYECVFNVMVINLEAAQERIAEFRWENDHFASRDVSGGWRPYRRSSAQHDFELTEAMEQRLEDPGATFSHPAKPKLVLEDIFVPPNAEELTFEHGKDVVKAGMVESRKLLTTIAERRRVLIIGRERSGKTTLGKVLFRQFYHQGLVPVLIEGGHIRSQELEKFTELVHGRLKEDYRNPLLDKFEQLDREKVVIIIDDLDHAHRLNAKGRLKLLENISTRYQRIIVLGDDLLRFEEVAYGDLGAKVLADYTQLELKEYGHVLRSALIDKWYDINSEYSANPDLLAQKVALAERAIDDIIRKSYLPSSPIFILTMLQGIDTSQPVDSSAGSYGYLYQVLITKQLAKTAGEIGLDKKLGYLVELAFHMFKRPQRELSELEFDAFHAKYCTEYTPVDRQKMFHALEQAGILEIYDRHYRFKYTYFYYYFVAQYFSRNLEREDVRKHVIGLCDELQKEEYANIWLFLTHQSRSDFLLDTIVAHATKFFAEIQPPEFGKDVAFLQKLYDKVPELVLVNKSPEEIRRERRQKLDQEATSEPISQDGGEETNEFLKIIVRLKAALRTLEVMGQIVKNFAGSMKNDPRYTLVKECYELGLRIVGIIHQSWEQSGERFVCEVLDLVLQKDTSIESREELEKMVKLFIFYFCETIALNVIKRISHAVGTKELAQTYPRVLEANPTNAYKLIDLSVKLDHLGFPTGDVYGLNEAFHDNVFCHRLLSHLVINHFYLFSTSDRVKQRVCNKLGIKIQDLRGIDVRTHSQKRLPKQSEAEE